MSDIEVASVNSQASIASAVAITRARRAALEVKRREAAKRAELLRKKAQLEGELEQQAISAEISAAEAEEQVLVAYNDDLQANFPLGCENLDNVSENVELLMTMTIQTSLHFIEISRLIWIKASITQTCLMLHQIL